MRRRLVNLEDSHVTRGRATSDAKSADEAFDDMRQLARAFHRDFVIAGEREPAGARQAARELRDGLRRKEHVSLSADNLLSFVNVSPLFDSLRSHKRFAMLQRALQLA